MEVNPYAGKLAEPAMLINVPKLVTAYFAEVLSQNLMLSYFMNRFKVYGSYKRTMATDCIVHSDVQSPTWKVRAAAAKPQSGTQWNTLDSANRIPLGRFAGAVSAEKHLPSTFPGMDRIGGLCQNTYGIGPGLERSWRQKKGDGVGKTKRGKGTKIMGLADAGGLPLFAWLQNFRRLVVRYEYHLENFLAMIQLGCIVILLRRVLG